MWPASPKSDKQKIAETFRASGGLDELDFLQEDDIAPSSMQPVVSLNADGQRQLELMRLAELAIAS